jgi:excisionase family DNA binding protein
VDGSMLTAQQAGWILGVSSWKVRDLAREGTLSAHFTKGGHRRYGESEVRELARRLHGSDPERHDGCGFPFGAPEHLAGCLRPATWGPQPGEQR